MITNHELRDLENEDAVRHAAPARHGARPVGFGTARGLRRHPTLAVGLASFVALFGVLMAKNWHLLSTPIHEDADMAANSIIIQDARELHQLVGNYSREQFHHPGPADLYVQAAGQAVLHDATGIVPTQFDGHAIAILALNAFLLALAMAIVYRHSRSVPAAALCLAAALAFCSAHQSVLSSTWMPDVYFAPFLLLLVAGASVAAGETRHLWCLALAAGFLVNGHAEFLLFAPVIGAAAIAALVIGHSGGRLAAFRAHGADWLTAAGVSALFLLPIGIDLALHWPGEFGKYLSYSSNHVGGHSLGAAWSYTAHFWSGWRNGYVLWGGVVVAAGVLAAQHRTATVRRFLLGCLAISGLATLLFVFYTVRGVDYLEPYIGYFYWAVPLTVILVTVIGPVDLVRATRASAGAMLLTAAVVTGLAMRGPGLENTYGGAPQLPALTRSLASLRTSTAQPLVLDIDHDTWPDAVAILVQADRVGVHACMADRFWTFMVTKEFVCAPAESASGLHLRLRNPAPGTRNVVATMLRSQITLAGSS